MVDISGSVQGASATATAGIGTGVGAVGSVVTPVVDAVADTVGAVGDVGEAVVGAAMSVASMLGARIPASLTCITPPNVGFVPFDFNPEKITMSRSSITRGVGKPQRPGATAAATRNTSGGSGSYAPYVKASKISLAELVFEGPFTKLRCDTLLTWMNPSAGLFAQFPSHSKNFTTMPAPLTFTWGPPMVGFMYDVKLTSCTVVYERFTPAGIPIRAKIKLDMEEVPSKLGSLPTNPTSGGLPGRRSHTVADGESLQSIAMANYGTPALWRRIAEVNRIQNPARLRPGTVVYLPNADELTAKARS